MKDYPECAACHFNTRCETKHPYGEGWATELWYECRLPEGDEDLCEGLKNATDD